MQDLDGTSGNADAGRRSPADQARADYDPDILPHACLILHRGRPQTERRPTKPGWLVCERPSEARASDERAMTDAQLPGSDAVTSIEEPVEVTQVGEAAVGGDAGDWGLGESEIGRCAREAELVDRLRRRPSRRAATDAVHMLPAATGK